MNRDFFKKCCWLTAFVMSAGLTSRASVDDGTANALADGGVASGGAAAWLRQGSLIATAGLAGAGHAGNRDNSLSVTISLDYLEPQDEVAVGTGVSAPMFPADSAGAPGLVNLEANPIVGPVGPRLSTIAPISLPSLQSVNLGVAPVKGAMAAGPLVEPVGSGPIAVMPGSVPPPIYVTLGDAPMADGPLLSAMPTVPDPAESQGYITLGEAPVPGGDGAVSISGPLPTSDYLNFESFGDAPTISPIPEAESLAFAALLLAPVGLRTLRCWQKR